MEYIGSLRYLTASLPSLIFPFFVNGFISRSRKRGKGGGEEVDLF